MEIKLGRKIGNSDKGLFNLMKVLVKSQIQEVRIRKECFDSAQHDSIILTIRKSSGILIIKIILETIMSLND
jgi:hypothetical protein